MLIHFLKFLHLLFTLGLFGLTIYCLALISSAKFTSKKNDVITHLNKMILVIAFFTLLTGSFLIYPKHFTFHTLWIQAAYLFIVIFCVGIFSLIAFKKKRKHRWLWRAAYLFLILILIGIIHDAVTKTTFL